jgi:SAM-dependent methyltransferase
MTKISGDPFGQQVLDYYNGLKNYLIIERDDGLIEVSSGDFYFVDYKAWPESEHNALNYAKGKILDIGCGPGRHSLYLQQEEYDVTAMDSSPLTIDVCISRGIKDTLIGYIDDIDKLACKKYDTILLMGNNLGLFQNGKAAPGFLKKLHGITADDAVIIAESSDPALIDDPYYQKYFKQNIQKGRLVGESKLRIRYKNIIGPWFDYLYIGTRDLEHILLDTGWRIKETLKTSSPQYYVILCK